MDQIDQRLSLLRNKLKERSSFVQILQESGLLIPVIGLVLGILIHDQTNSTRSIWWVPLGILSGFVSLKLVPITKKHYRTISFILLVFTLLGFLRAQHYQTIPPHDLFHSMAIYDRPITLRGTIINRPKQHEQHIFDHSSVTTTFRFRTHQTRSRRDWIPCTSTIQVIVNGNPPDLNPGDQLLIHGLCKPLSPPSNPGQFDFARYLNRRNIRLQLQVKDPNSLTQEQPASRFAWTSIRAHSHRHAQQALLDHLPRDNPETGLLLALLLGQREQITPALQEAFKKTGLLHIISLSGLHIGIIAGTVWYLGRLLGLLKRGRALLCTLVLIYFVIIIPARGPTMRAAIIGWSLCGAFLFRRRPSPWHSLALSACILLLLRPSQLFEAGWQLSFACVASILLLTNPLMDAFDRATNGWSKSGSKLNPWIRRPIRATVNLFMVGFSASLGGSGILLAHFYTITPLASIWTLLIFPLVAFILPLGFIKILLGWLPGLSYVLAQVLQLLASFFITLVENLSTIPGNTWIIGHGPGWHIFGYYLILLIALLLWKKHYPDLCLKKVAFLAFSLLIYSMTPLFRTHQGLTLTCLDVGHGQAVILRQQKQTWLFDAGSLYRSSVGRSIINPFLDYSGINRLKAATLSHHDIDHIIGLPDVARHCRIQHFLANPTFQTRLTETSPLAPLFETGKYQLQDINSTTQHLPPHTKILWPIDDPTQNSQSTDNNASAVIQLEYAHKKILLCGDIEAEVQQHLLKIHPNLKTDILLAPHHGSLKTLAPEFVTQLDPAIILCSCSHSQFSQGRVLTDQENGKVYLTACDGAITLNISPEGECQVQTMKNQNH